MPQSNPSAGPGTYASIMVPVDLDAHAAPRARLAASLADRFSSHLIGIAAHRIDAPLYFEAPVERAESIIQIEERRAADNIAKAEAIFRDAARGVNRVEWRHALALPLDFILEQARSADLIVTDRSWLEERMAGPMKIDGGDLVMGAGRPVLFVPPGIDHLAAKRVVVGWKDCREARRAVLDSLPLLRDATEVFIAAIDATDTGAKDVAAYLGRHGVEASTLCRTTPTGAAADELVQTAQQEGADLIVAGAYGHSQMREWIFGGVTQDLLDHSPLCCLMTH